MLAFDTATPAITVALHDGSATLSEHHTVDASRHGELLAPAIVRVLESAGVTREDVTGVAVGVGPGPFTGLRVGLATARTLGAVFGVPVHGVCTLDVVALATEVSGPFLVATNARRKEVYCASYADRETRVGGPEVARPADVASPLPVAGEGAVLYPEHFPAAVAPEYPSAAVLAEAALRRTVPLLEPVPLYLRRPDVAEPGARKPVL